jgi:hypothetical protein
LYCREVVSLNLVKKKKEDKKLSALISVKLSPPIFKIFSLYLLEKISVRDVFLCWQQEVADPNFYYFVKKSFV